MVQLEHYITNERGSHAYIGDRVKLKTNILSVDVSKTYIIRNISADGFVSLDDHADISVLDINDFSVLKGERL